MDNNISNETRVIMLYCEDYKVSYHVREIARKIGTSHRTISLTLQGLEKKNIMISRQVGKNKEYILNLQNITTREYIHLAEIRKTIGRLEKYFFIKKLITEKRNNICNLPIVLFGSYAKETAKKESDIDILIFTDHQDYSETAENELKKFARQNGKILQIQKGSRENFEKGLREKDPLIMEIIKSHIILNNYEYFIGILWRYAHEK